jgi:hypothetical protein
MAQHVVGMIPADGWECLLPCVSEDDIVVIKAVPVIAWAINPLGEIRPIIPNLMAVSTAEHLGEPGAPRSM